MTDNVNEQLAALRLRTQTDVQRMWELLMQPLGFAALSLWVTFVDHRDAPIPMLLQVTEDDEVPTIDEVGSLCDVLRHVVDERRDISSVAFLLSRPGRGGLIPSDRQLAHRLIAGAQAVGLPCAPVHVANDVAVLAIAPDDLVA